MLVQLDYQGRRDLDDASVVVEERDDAAVGLSDGTLSCCGGRVGGM